MNAEQIIAALRARYRPPEWAFFDEIRSGTGYDYGRLTGHAAKHSVEKRLDAWAFHLWPTGGYQPTGFEVKVSRSDFLRDIKNGHKRGRYLELCQYFYYVVPAGLVKASEVTDDSGLMSVSDLAGRVSVLKPAPHKEMPAPEWDFFAAICRRVAEAGWPRFDTVRIPDGWRPTPEAVNALPSPLRSYIHSLETNTDPASMVAENALLKDQVRQLASKVELQYWDERGALARMLVALVYLWTRDACVPVAEMQEYAQARFRADVFSSNGQVEYSDKEREALARQLVRAYLQAAPP